MQTPCTNGMSVAGRCPLSHHCTTDVSVVLSVHAVHRAEGKQTRLPSSDVVREIGRVLQLVSWGNAKGVSTRCHQG